jgi:hypothetical protein
MSEYQDRMAHFHGKLASDLQVRLGDRELAARRGRKAELTKRSKRVKVSLAPIRSLESQQD